MTVDPGMPTFTVGNGNPRGICRVCGKPASKGTSTLCLEHGGKPKKSDMPKVTTTAAPDGMPTVEMGPDGPKIVLNVPKDTKKTIALPDKTARAAELETSILKINPVLLQGYAMLCKPIDPSNFYTAEGSELTITPLGQQVVITQMEAQILGKAMAEIEDSPALKMVTGAMGPVIPIAYLVAAVGVVGFHGYKLAGLRTQLMLQVQQAPQYSGPTGVVPEQAPTGTGEPAQAHSNGWATAPPFDPSDIGTPQP